MLMCVLSSEQLERLEGKNSWKGFTLILTRLREEPRNFYYIYCRINTHSWMILGLQHIGSNSFFNLLPTLANIKVVDDTETACSSGSDSEDITSILQEDNEVMEATEAMDLRVSLRAQRKRPRIGKSIINMVVSSKDDTDSGRLELSCKRKADHVGTSTMMITASPFTSSQTAACKSSHVPACGNSPPISVSPLSVPPPIEPPLGNRGLKERISRTKAIQKELEVNLKVFKEQWQGMRSENEVLYKQNEELARRLGAKGVKNDELASEVVTLHAELKEVNEEYKVVVSRINTDYEDATATLKCNQEESFKGFKKNTLKMLSDVTVKLKYNILLLIKVAVGPFDVRMVDFDALIEGSLKLTIISVGDDTANTLTANNFDVVEEEERGEVGWEEDEGREDEVPGDQFEI
ncbi:hypothetical protein J1N35_004911 [Gossypium stocksii]|uniref:Uncharacterized protein n=1 Tax=Gossypium stocksii TaxID=47602 RepID=A0A9D3WCV6_9ROSI|nr:hypothetical protein J1N35_004911 [Gossypium stocksii]